MMCFETQKEWVEYQRSLKEMKKTPIKKKKLTKKKSKPTEADQQRLDLVLALTLQTQALELAKNEYMELAPLPGMCGPFRLSGNSLPVFTYRVFDPRKKPFMMEFVQVRVEVSKPDRIHYIATIDSHGSQDPARHGEAVEVLSKYKEPFEKLSQHLFNYFPYYRNTVFDRKPDRKDAPKQIEKETHG